MFWIGEISLLSCSRAPGLVPGTGVHCPLGAFSGAKEDLDLDLKKFIKIICLHCGQFIFSISWACVSSSWLEQIPA